MSDAAKPENAENAVKAEEVLTELFFTKEGRQDPYPRYKLLREMDPVHFSEAIGALVLTRYDDVVAATRDPRLERGFELTREIVDPSWRKHASLVHLSRSMLMEDGERHARLRRAVSRSFTPKVVAALRPAVEQLVAELVDPFVAASGGDFMAEVAFPLPAAVIAALLGVPQGDLAPFRDWATKLVATLELGASEEELLVADAADAALRDFFVDVVAAKRRNPGDDLLSALAAGEGSEEGLSASECIGMAVQLLVAGFETTTNTMGNAVLAFAKQPEQIALLHEDPERYRVLPEEILRHSGSVHLLGRIATEATVLNGTVEVPAGQPVVALLAAANRDPGRFPDPDRLDCRRTDVRPTTFGGGLHYCVGAALARLELECCFARLLEQVDGLEVTGPVEMLDRLTLFGPRVLPLAAISRKSDTRGGMPRASSVELPPGEQPGSHEVIAEGRIARQLADANPISDGPSLLRIRGSLKRARFLAGASEDALNRLAQSAYVAVFRPGEILMSEGDASSNCYLLAEGEVEIRKSGSVVAVVGADEVVGEVGALFGTARSATVVATSDVVAWSLSRERLFELGEENPGLLEDMRAQAAWRGLLE